MAKAGLTLVCRYPDEVADAPIGIFDSGVGGLTVARSVLDLLPHEPILYVGDTARGPYGPRPIAEVRAFALDVMDLVGYKNRPSRLWNALAAIPLATEGPRPGEVVLQVVNYGQPTRDEVQARVLGHYAKATFISPNRSAETLRTYKRGLMTEVYMPRIERVGLVHFTGA